MKASNPKQPALPCPFCGGPTRVRDSRHYQGGVRRRRQCRACENRFTTVEVLVGADDFIRTNALESVSERVDNVMRVLGEAKHDVDSLVRLATLARGTKA